MTDREKFFDTVGILVEAYLNETLVHGEPCGCAVGNIIAKKIGAKIIIEPTFDGYTETPKPRWINCKAGVDLDGYDWFQRIRAGQVKFGDPEMGERHINLTGYTIKEIDAIERAFESVCKVTSGGQELRDPDIDYEGYLGLMAVCDVLAFIHNIDLSTRESAKLLFVKQ
jgi:hypothetical protein